MLFLEAYTAPKRLLSFRGSPSTGRKEGQDLTPSLAGRIRTGRYSRLLPQAMLRNTDVGSSFSTCTICLDVFQASDEAARLPCGHIFHDDCLREWLHVRLECPFRCPTSAPTI